MPKNEQEKQKAYKEYEDGLRLKKKKEAITGQVIWISSIEENFFYEKTGLSISDLIRQGRLTAADGSLCPPPPAGLKDPQKVAEYYHNWLREQLEGAGVSFYEKPGSKLPQKIRFDVKEARFRASHVEKEEEPKKPGWWNRRRDRKLLAAGKPGTPEMEEYRRKVKELAEGKARREKYAKVDQMKQQCRDNLKMYSEMDPKDFSPEQKDNAIKNIANLMMCESLSRFEANDPKYGAELLEDIVDAVDNKETEPNLSGDKERNFVKGQIDELEKPSDLNKFLEEGGTDSLRKSWAANERLMKKTIDSAFFRQEKQDPAAEKADPELAGQIRFEAPGWDKKTMEIYEKLDQRANEALNHLKDIGVSGGTIPEFMLPQVKKELALVSLQATLNTAIRTDKTDLARQIVQKLGSDEPYTDKNGIAASDFDRAVRHFQDQYVDKLITPGMKSQKLADFLAENRENEITKSFIEENSKPVYVLNDNVFGKAPEKVEQKKFTQAQFESVFGKPKPKNAAKQDSQENPQAGKGPEKLRKLRQSSSIRENPEPEQPKQPENPQVDAPAIH